MQEMRQRVKLVAKPIEAMTYRAGLSTTAPRPANGGAARPGLWRISCVIPNPTFLLYLSA
jgi:hypothetical protein